MTEIRADLNSEFTRRPESTAPEKANLKQSAQSGKVMPPEAKLTEVSAEELKEAVSQLNSKIQNTSRALNFQVDEDTGKTVIRVYDKDSNNLIRQIPNELALEMAKRLSDDDPTFLFTAQV